MKPGQGVQNVLTRQGGHEPDHRHRLLRARRNRPSDRRATEQRDELAASDHSITSSVSASNLSGIWRPSAFAALRLITNSNLVGCSTASSAGFVPFNILSTYSAARR